MSPGKPRDDSFPDRIRKVYTAVTTSEGRVLPIVETVGRRVLREIDAQSREGARLLQEGRVQLWTDAGARAGRPSTHVRPSVRPEHGLRRLPGGKPPPAPDDPS